jgi:hypothetical protein
LGFVGAGHRGALNGKGAATALKAQLSQGRLNQNRRPGAGIGSSRHTLKALPLSTRGKQRSQL